MIFKQIPLRISDGQTKKLIALNEKILKHLEEGHGVRVSVLNDLEVELSKVLQTQSSLIKILEKIKSSGDYFDILLSHQNNKILNLPWTLAKDPISGESLGNIQQLLLSKCPPKSFKKSKDVLPPLAPPLKILIMISSPEDADHKNRLSFEEEEFEILKAFQPLLESGLVQIDFTDDASLETLTHKIKANKYHILHYSGHAIFKENTGYLALENPLDLKTDRVEAAEFANALNCNPDYKIPIVILSSCQTAKGSTDAGLRGVTNHLLKIGTPAVIAMGASIQDKYATYFSSKFYEQLAKKRNILSAFNIAINKLKEFEFNEQAKGGIRQPHPLQWIIPNLYRSRTIKHPVDWALAKEKLERSSFRFIYEQDRLLLKHEKDYLFIGRRKDKASIVPHIFKKKTIFLKGQGGVGKTALAEHLVQRLILADGRTQPFVFNETVKSIHEIQKLLENYLESKNKLERTELNLREKGLDQFKYLAFAVAEICQPVFIFDNLESFQSAPNKGFSEEYQDIKDVIDFLCQTQKFYVILTGRYSIPDFSDVRAFDLNQVGINDFWRKCHNLELSKIVEDIQNEESTEKKPPKFFDIVDLLHQTFGGNFRALELFNELFRENPHKIKNSLTTLETFRDEYKNETNRVKEKMGRDLIFTHLLNLLKKDQHSLLSLLTHFRIPVQRVALQLQLDEQKKQIDLSDALLNLHNLTLLEISLDCTTDTIYYYCTPIVKDLLNSATDDANILTFSHQKAGIYHYYDYHNLSSTLTELEEAFYHFHRAKIKKKVNEIGTFLSGSYYDYFLFQNAFFYATRTYQLLAEETSNRVLNRLGLILKLYGDYDQALSFYQKALSGYLKIGDKSGEGTTLNNISLIYNARGDNETALSYLERSLKISQEIGDKSVEGATLNNISLIYDARGDNETALSYLERSLKIRQEIGDKSGEGATLNNISLIYDARGEYETALSYLERSLKILQEIGNKSGEGATLSNISLIYDARGEYETALSYLERSLKILQEIGNKSGEGTTLNNISQIFKARGEYETALSYLERSLKISQQIGDKSVEGTTLNNISGIFSARGDYDMALSYLERSLKISQQIGDKSGEGSTLNNISQIYNARGDYETALSYLERSLKIRQQIGDKSGEGSTLNNISQIYDARGEYETALSYLERSLKISQQIGDKSGEGTTLNNISQIFKARGEYETALSYLERSLKISQQIGDKSGMIPTLHNMAMIAHEKKDFQKDIEYTSRAYQLATETKNAMGLFHVGQRWGQMLYAIGKKEEGLQIMKTSCAIGKQAGFPDVDSVADLIKQLKES